MSPFADAERSWVPAGPLDPLATLAPLRHGPADPTFRAMPDAAWRAVRLASGPATVRLSWTRGPGRTDTRERSPLDRRAGGTTRGTLVDPARGDRVLVHAWGSGAAEAAAQAPAWLGAADDWSGFDSPAFAATLPESVSATRRMRPGLHLTSGGSLVDTLLAVILEQRVTGLEAHGAWRRLVTRFGEPAPGGHDPDGHGPLFVPPRPEAWRRIPSWEWHAARVDAARRDALVGAAARAAALERLEAEAGTGPAGLAALDSALSSLRGVGVWTVAETLQRTHGAPDHVSFGDFHVAHFVGRALTGRRVDDAGMEALLAPWAGHRQRVVRLLGASGARNPSFGPRLAPQDHRRH